MPDDLSLRPYPNVPRTNLDGDILAEMNKDKIVGVSAAFVKDSQVVWSNGYGWANLESESPATADTRYRIASISKTITATALMQLWEMGLFNLNDDISQYLGYQVRNPYFPDDQITFLMLLTHTSSIFDSGGYNQVLNSPNPPLLREILVPGGRFYSLSTWGNFQPGSQFSYSNFGIGIIGALVEVISGEHFNQYAVSHIFRPLGMDAGYEVADIIHVDRIAVLYEASGHGMFRPAYDNLKGIVPPRRPQRPLGNYYIGPAGAVRSSVLDLSKFMIAHVNGGVYNGVRILNKGTDDLMQQIQCYGNGLKGFYRMTGLDFHITDALVRRRLRGHAGEAWGLVSDMYFSRDENLGVIFITNGGYYKALANGFTDIEVSIINAIFKEFSPVPPVITRRITALDGDNKLVANGRYIYYSVSPDDEPNDVYIPAMNIADALNAVIEFDANTDTLTLIKGTQILRVKASEPSFYLNNTPVVAEKAPYYKVGYLMLPIVQVSQLLGANVTYIGAQSEIIIRIGF